MIRRQMASALMVAGMFLATPVIVRADGAAEDLYYKAWHAETADRDLDRALSMYREIVEKHGSDSLNVAKALLQIGGCLEKQGKLAEAQEAYQKVVAGYEAEREVAEKAKSRLEALKAGAAQPSGETAGLSPYGTPGRVPSGKTADPGAALAQKLDTLKIDVDFTDTGMHDILDFIREFAGLNIVVDRARLQNQFDRTVSFRVKSLVLRAVIDLLCKQYDAAFLVHEGVLLITTPEGVAAMKQAGAARNARMNDAGASATAKEVLAKLQAQRTALDFTETPLSDVIDFVRAFANINIVMQSDLKDVGSAPLSLRVADLPLAHVFALICDLNGIDYDVDENGVVLLHKAAVK